MSLCQFVSCPRSLDDIKLRSEIRFLLHTWNALGNRFVSVDRKRKQVNSVQRGPPRETRNRWACQEIILLLWNWEVPLRVHTDMSAVQFTSPHPVCHTGRTSGTSFGFHKRTEISLTGWATVRFSRRTCFLVLVHYLILISSHPIIWVLNGKLVVAELLKNFPEFYRTQNSFPC
jgi:hypothetical protein